MWPSMSDVGISESRANPLAGETLRFIAPAPRLGDRGDFWREDVQHIEELGFDIVAVSEHYTGGWSMEPLTALAFAAAFTNRVRLLSLVLNNDLRHPAMLAKAVSTADVLSGGRMMLGVGAGWLAADYDALGVTFDRAQVRLSRLEEALTIMRAFLAGSTVDHHGTHYQVHGLEALPPPTRAGGPPILVGGGGPRILRLAGHVADVVGIHVTLGAGKFDDAAARELSLEQIRHKVDIVNRAASEVGRRRPELQFTPAVVVIDGERSTAERPGFTDYITSHRREFGNSPSVLIGDAQSVGEQILHWQGELGIELWHLGGRIDAVSRVIKSIPSTN